MLTTTTREATLEAITGRKTLITIIGESGLIKSTEEQTQEQEELALVLPLAQA